MGKTTYKVYKNNGGRGWELDDKKEFLFEVADELKFGPFKINGAYYSIECINHQHNYAIVTEMEIKEYDTDFTGEIKCPTCGDELMDSWEMDESGEWTCDSCYSEISYQRNVEVTYSSKLIKRRDIKELELHEKTRT